MAEEEKVYVSNATNPLKKVMMCSPRYYQFNGINVITAEWMKKGDQEKNDVMVAEWQMLVDAFKDNGIEVVEVEARPCTRWRSRPRPTYSTRPPGRPRRLASWPRPGQPGRTR